jgi:hypothetical protein
MFARLSVLAAAGCAIACLATGAAQAGPNSKSGVTFGGGVPGGGNPGPALPSSSHIPQGVGPGNTGNSGVTFGGGVPAGQSPGPAVPSSPTKKK